MARRDLLPGIETDSCPPRVVVNSRDLVLRARRVAALRDIANLILLGMVDYAALYWPSTHFPFLGREDSIVLLALVNSAFITHAIMSRLVARWSARRIATTWCLRERARFFQGPL
ncbi:MAG TPA: hypothetical protein VM779_14000 [Thermoanaerobaculia bacterium]|nr:hypothetical protein [Thermoanaerobaculia bacterium]